MKLWLICGCHAKYQPLTPKNEKVVAILNFEEMFKSLVISSHFSEFYYISGCMYCQKSFHKIFGFHRKDLVDISFCPEWP